MNIEIVEAGEQDQTVIRNLTHFYIYDLAVIMGWDCPGSGLFDGNDDLPEYWGKRPEDPHYAWPADWRGYPYLIRVDGKLAGFALVKKTGEGCFEMGEFFILRIFGGKGIGRHVAHQLFAKFPGRWTVEEMVGNAPAQAFWRKVISEYTSGNYEESTNKAHGFELTTQRFGS